MGGNASAREAMRQLQAPIRVFSVFDAEDIHQHDVIMNGVKGTKIAVPNPIGALLSGQRPRSRWPWIICQCFDLGKESDSDIQGELIEFLPGFLIELDFVGQLCSACRAISASNSCRMTSMGTPPSRRYSSQASSASF